MARRTKGAYLSAIITTRFWFEEEVNGTATDEGRTIGTSLLELATVLLWDSVWFFKSWDIAFVLLCEKKLNELKSESLRLSKYSDS